MADDNMMDSEMTQFAQVQQQRVSFHLILIGKFLWCIIYQYYIFNYNVTIAHIFLQVMLQEGIMKINNVCFDKCITGKPGSSLDSWTEGCITNCVGR